MVSPDAKILELETMLGFYTNHLNAIQQLTAQVRMYRKMPMLRDLTGLDERLSGYELQLSFNGFLTAANLDLIVTAKNFLQVKQVWEEIYYLRHAYLSIEAVLATYHKAHSGWLREQEVVKQEFASFSARLRAFQKTYDVGNEVKRIRNTVTAHITGDFNHYFSIISGFDRKRATGTMLEFIEILSNLLHLSTNLLTATKKTIEMESSSLDAHINELIDAIFSKFKALKE